MFGLLADAILIIHLGFILFVVLGQVAIMIGGLRAWRWVRHRGFRLGHLLAIWVVIIPAWLGWLCPLTVLENALRRRSGEPSYDATFIGHWVGRLIYVQLPLWLLAILYALFGLLVVWSWWRIRPNPSRNRIR